MQSYLFYDIETTGLNKSFDQILQFAAIRTDLSLNEKERYNIKVRLRPDIIPSPYAAITHRISIESCEDGLTELEAIRHIHALFNTPGTISVGYNTLGFDDEFIRFAFYRNLLPPYTHQYAGGCGRADILPVAALYHLYRPEVINWPDIDGKPSLKLEHIAEANDFDLGRAHDAMVDVEATLELAKRFFSERKMWDYISGFFEKKSDNERLTKLPVAFESSLGMHMTGLMADVKFGPDRLYQAPVLYIGNSEPYANQGLWLQLDLVELKDTDPTDIEATTRVVRKRSGEAPVILPPLDRFLTKLTDERRRVIEDNLKWLKANQDLFYKIIAHYRKYTYPEVDGVDIDGALYLNGFLSREEQTLSNRFHQSSREKLPDIIREFGKSPCAELAERICYRNGIELTGVSASPMLEQFIIRLNPESESEVLIDFRGDKRLTPEAALMDIEEIRSGSEIDAEQIALLDEIETHIQTRYTCET